MIAVQAGPSVLLFGRPPEIKNVVGSDAAYQDRSRDKLLERFKRHQLRYDM